MPQPNIGIDIDDFRLGPKEALSRAAELAFRDIELGTASGELSPSNLSGSGRRHLARLVDGLGLRMAALVADVPGLRLTDPRTVDERVERTCRILELAADLKVPTVTASVGALTHPDTGEPSPGAIQALSRIGEFADSRGVRYALRPSRDGGERIVRVLEALRCPSIGICMDPAAMVMAGANPVASIERYVGQIILMHARDGTSGLAEHSGRETPLGEGDVDLQGLLAVLEMAEYRGPYVLRRTDSQNPAIDLAAAREHLERLLG